MWKIYSDLTKFGIVIFVVLTGLAGYATSFAVETEFAWQHLATLLGGLYFLSSGSLALNQVQEYKIDQKMPRTAKRPIASGRIKPAAGLILAVAYLFIGSGLLVEISPLCFWLGALTVVLYNVVYVYWWKPKWVFGAVPGAIPGALPVTIGYAANNDQIFNSESMYLFLILFLWQMPHFWALALKFKNDYASADFPTMPVTLGVQRTLYHMGLYTFLYVGVAIASPWFVHSSWVFLLLVIPFSAKVLLDFFRLLRSNAEKGWLSFFLWTNASVLVFLFVPVIDKWNFLYIGSN
jgi:protoheme IX farnesyltransferase